MGSLLDYVKRTIKNNIKLICLISCIIISFAYSNRSNDDYTKKIKAPENSKFTVKLSNQLPYTVENFRNSNKSEMYAAYKITDFFYTSKENYATKNNDLTLGIKFISLYKYRSFIDPGDEYDARLFLSLIDENGEPAKIEPVANIMYTFDTAKELPVGLDVIDNNLEQKCTWKLYDIPDGHYTLILDNKKNN